MKTGKATKQEITKRQKKGRGRKTDGRTKRQKKEVGKRMKTRNQKEAKKKT